MNFGHLSLIAVVRREVTAGLLLLYWRLVEPYDSVPVSVCQPAQGELSRLEEVVPRTLTCRLVLVFEPTHFRLHGAPTGILHEPVK